MTCNMTTRRRTRRGWVADVYYDLSPPCAHLSIFTTPNIYYLHRYTGISQKKHGINDDHFLMEVR